MLNQAWVSRWKAAAHTVKNPSAAGDHSLKLTPAQLFATVGLEFMRSVRHMVVHLTKDPARLGAFSPTEIICQDLGLTDEIFAMFVQDGMCRLLIKDETLKLSPDVYKVENGVISFRPVEGSLVSKT